jgi:hypothetical protein
MFGQEKKMEENIPCMMNIFRETCKIVEIEFIHNMMIVISLCLMIWNRNDCEWWNEHMERMAHVSATVKDLGKKILKI